MPNYSKGKIYKVVCSETDRIYIGSTVQPLYKRLYGHKHIKSNRCKTNDFIEPKIYLVEDFSCDRKEQLEARERHYIETLECVNKVIPCRTEKEKYEYFKQWYKKNKEHKIITDKEYKEKNKEKIKKQNKELYEKNKQEINKKRYLKIICCCGAEISLNNKVRHEKSNKHNKFIKNEETHENNIE